MIAFWRSDMDLDWALVRSLVSARFARLLRRNGLLLARGREIALSTERALRLPLLRVGPIARRARILRIARSRAIAVGIRLRRRVLFTALVLAFGSLEIEACGARACFACCRRLRCATIFDCTLPFAGLGRGGVGLTAGGLILAVAVYGILKVRYGFVEERTLTGVWVAYCFKSLILACFRAMACFADETSVIFRWLISR